MKPTLLLALITLLLPITLAANIDLWPLPANVGPITNTLSLDPNFHFRATNAQTPILNRAFNRYKALIFWQGPPTKGFHLPVLTLDVNVASNSENLDQNTDESYTLDVTAPISTLRSQTVFGALRGLETFSQLVKPYNRTYDLVGVRIQDAPRFSFRGVMIDTSRHFLPMAVLLQALDAMSYDKFNVLHWHVVDDQSFPYRSAAFPDLSDKGAYSPTHVYSRSDVQAVVNYAKDRGIRVIPEFDTPGHTASWGLGYPELLTPCYTNGKPNGDRYALNPISNFTYDFVTKFWGEVAQAFPDTYVHVGGDEVDFTCWQSNPDIQAFMAQRGWTSYSLLEQYYERKLLDIVAGTGKNYIVWEDVFDNGVIIQPNTVIDVWKCCNWESVIYNATAAGYPAILSAPWYLNYISYGENWPYYYKVDPWNFNGTDAQKKLVIGGECTFWAEFIDATNLIPRAWPRSSAIAERLWSPQNVTDLDDAEARIHSHRCRMLTRNIPAEPPNGPSFCEPEFKYVYIPPWQN